VCFRARFPGAPDDEADRRNEALMERVNATGEVYLSHTRLRGRTVLRVAVGNIRTEERHLRRAFELLRSEAERLAAQG
jgi:aromatic-L-amino-acid decarboxylase